MQESLLRDLISAFTVGAFSCKAFGGRGLVEKGGQEEGQPCSALPTEFHVTWQVVEKCAETSGEGCGSSVSGDQVCTT